MKQCTKDGKKKQKENQKGIKNEWWGGGGGEGESRVYNSPKAFGELMILQTFYY